MLIWMLMRMRLQIFTRAPPRQTPAEWPFGRAQLLAMALGPPPPGAAARIADRADIADVAGGSEEGSGSADGSLEDSSADSGAASDEQIARVYAQLFRAGQTAVRRWAAARGGQGGTN
jgi:hypothetical protein